MLRSFVPAVLVVSSLIAVLCPVAPAAAQRASMVGGWKNISNVNDHHIQELGSWAVAMHSKKTNGGLQFTRVVSAAEQVVSGSSSGVKYMLSIDARHKDGKSKIHGAVVYEDVSTKERDLIFFTPEN